MDAQKFNIGDILTRKEGIYSKTPCLRIIGYSYNESYQFNSYLYQFNLYLYQSFLIDSNSIDPKILSSPCFYLERDYERL